MSIITTINNPHKNITILKITAHKYQYRYTHTYITMFLPAVATALVEKEV